MASPSRLDAGARGAAPAPHAAPTPRGAQARLRTAYERARNAPEMPLALGEQAGVLDRSRGQLLAGDRRLDASVRHHDHAADDAGEVLVLGRGQDHRHPAAGGAVDLAEDVVA